MYSEVRLWKAIVLWKCCTHLINLWMRSWFIVLLGGAKSLKCDLERCILVPGSSLFSLLPSCHEQLFVCTISAFELASYRLDPVKLPTCISCAEPPSIPNVLPIILSTRHSPLRVICWSHLLPAV